MRLSRIRPLLALAGVATISLFNAKAFACGDPFAPAAGETGSTAVPASDPSIIAWADGYENYLVGAAVDAQWQTPEKALNVAGNSNGAAEGFSFDIVSLGHSGQITLTFSTPISNGEGCDFAVFENSFSNTFLELAWVEVSSNGTDFFRFSGASLTASPVGGFGSVNTTNIEGFAGKYRGGFGTPFDLDRLDDDANLDKNRITHIRIVDIVGDGSETDNISPPVGPNPIYDPYPTSGSAGFDLDAIAVFHQVEQTEHLNVPLSPFTTITLGLLLCVVNACLKNQPFDF